MLIKNNGTKSAIYGMVLFIYVFITTMGFTANTWEQFNPEPLTLIYPEEMAISNPPFFHWQCVPAAAKYSLTVSGGSFSRTWVTKYNFYTPAEYLPDGSYTIQITALDVDDKSLMPSKTGQFITKRQPYKPMPELNSIPADRTAPLLFTPDILKTIKEATGERAIYRDQILEFARSPLPPELVDLKEPERYQNGVWDFALWKQNNTLCFTIERRLLSLSLGYTLTKEQEMYEKAHGIITTVLAWDPQGSTGVWENDHSAQALLHALSVAYDSFHDIFSPEERNKIQQIIRIRCEDAYEFLNPFVTKDTSAGPMNDPDNNHPWFTASSLGFGGLALLGELPEAVEWTSFVAQMFYGVFLPRGGMDGGWHEGIDYWSYALYFVFQFCDVLETKTGIDLYQHPWLQNTGFFKIYVHSPAGGYVPFGDCKHHPPNIFDKLIMMRLASKFNDPLAWRYVDAVTQPIDNEGYLFYSLLWSQRSATESASAPPVPFAVHFRDIGWVVSNNDLFDISKQILFAFRSGKFQGRSFGHTHADQNHFIIMAGGDKLLWDAGYYDSYLSPHHRNYSRLTDAHNSILINGTGQVVHMAGIDGKITRFVLEGKKLVVQGDASKSLIYGGRLVRFLRTITYENEQLFIIDDDIMARELSNISLLLHSEFPIKYDPGKHSIYIQGKHYKIEGLLDSDIPVEAIIRERYPVAPNRPSNVLNERDTYPEQYHLEIRTVDKVETWTPRMTLKLLPIQESGELK